MPEKKQKITKGNAAKNSEAKNRKPCGGSGSEALERPRKRTKASGAGGAEENVTSKQSGKGKRKNEVETPEKGEAKQDEKRIQAKKKDLSRKSMAYVAARKKALADGLPEEEAKPKGREATRL